MSLQLLDIQTRVARGQFFPQLGGGGGGGGGGAGPNLLVSTIAVSGSSPADGSSLTLGGLSPEGALLNYTNPTTTFGQIQFQQILNAGPLGGVQINAGQTSDAIRVGNSKIELAAPLTTANALQATSLNGGPLNRSTIGAFPIVPSGGVSVPANSSTLVTSCPVGMYAYTLFGQNTTQDAVVNGFFNVLTDTNTSAVYASLSASFASGGVGAQVFPYLDVSAPSNPRLGLANNSIRIFDTVGVLNRIA